MKEGLFNHETLRVKFGGELSKPENIFEAKAIKVPAYKYKKKERESLGNGWYGSMETNDYIEDNAYIILRDNKCIGIMFPPHKDFTNIKRPLIPVNKNTRKEILDFIENWSK